MRPMANGRARVAVISALCLAAGALSAFADGAATERKEPILVPQAAYVGDRARLIVPLSPEESAAIRNPLVIDVADRLPRSKDVVVHRIELQRFEGSWRAIVDFVAYAPGTVRMPRIEAGGIALSDLSVPIASLLDAQGGAADLSPAPGPLPAPGTATLVYGTVLLLVLLALAGTFLFLRGPALLREAMERRRRGLAARSMRRVTSRLAENIDAADPSEFLSILLSELRSYLTYRTGVNFVALTPSEFPSAVAAASGLSAENRSAARLTTADGVFLQSLFRRGDEVRFGRMAAAGSELRGILDGVVALVDRTESAPESPVPPADGADDGLDPAFAGPKRGER